MNKISLTWSHQQTVAHLTMTSPANLNAMDDAMAAAFREATASLQGEGLRAVVVRGEGRAFSAGGDLDMLRQKAERDEATNRQQMREFYQSFLGLRDLEVPLLCLLQGHVVGAGFCFAAACDLRLGDRSARFAAPFTRLGLHPGMGGSYFLPRALGEGVARDLMLTGATLDAERAYQIGFLSRLVDLGHLDAALEETLQSLLLGAPLATQAWVRNQRRAEREALSSALEREALEQARCYGRPEFLTGLTALQQRRPPVW